MPKNPFTVASTTRSASNPALILREQSGNRLRNWENALFKVPLKGPIQS